MAEDIKFGYLGPDKGYRDPGQLPNPGLEVERSILGAILADPNVALPLALETSLKPDDFSHDAHGMIFEAMVELYNERKGVDLVLLKSKLGQKKLLQMVGGTSCLSEIDDQYGMPGNVKHYCDLIVDRAILRALSAASANIMELCRSNPPSVPELLDQSEALIFGVRDSRNTSRLVHVSDLIKNSIDPFLKEIVSHG
jgi:replicative DNA helicase